jgi:hypothetical protein
MILVSSRPTSSRGPQAGRFLHCGWLYRGFHWCSLPDCGLSHGVPTQVKAVDFRRKRGRVCWRATDVPSKAHSVSPFDDEQSRTHIAAGVSRLSWQRSCQKLGRCDEVHKTQAFTDARPSGCQTNVAQVLSQSASDPWR